MLLFFHARSHSYCLSPSLAFFFVLVLIAVIAGCQRVQYYHQAAKGQYAIIRAKKPIETVIDNPESPHLLKHQLQKIIEIREYGRRQLALPIDGNFSSYVDLRRQYVVWNVFAAPSFSVAPKTWCFPVIGCTNYLGWFSESDARASAQQLKTKGYDTYVAGITAYSTLGWFEDPVLSTYVYRPATHLAALIFHEAAHNLLYIPDDSTFNESFATAVEHEGLRRWLAINGKAELFERYAIDFKRNQQVIALIIKYRKRLAEIYADESPAELLAVRKAEIFRQLKKDYQFLKNDWAGYRNFDGWFNQDLNNAHLVSVSTYYQWLPAFQQILWENGNDLEAFYKECRQLGKLPKDTRNQILEKYSLERQTHNQTDLTSRIFDANSNDYEK
jgi:predicted aminopeptidase